MEHEPVTSRLKPELMELRGLCRLCCAVLVLCEAGDRCLRDQVCIHRAEGIEWKQFQL